MSRRTVIASAARTPFGKFGGALKQLSAVQLGGRAIGAAIERSGLRPELAGQVIMGHALQAGCGQNSARQAARLGGLPWDIPAETINKVCASGLRAVIMGDQMIRAGDADAIIAGGMESMSNAPYAIAGMRWGQRMGGGTAEDLMLRDGLFCPFEDVHMAAHGSFAATEYGISRKEQDEWALRSHVRATAAMDEGKLAEEIEPVVLQGENGSMIKIDCDEAPRRAASLSALAKLEPVYASEGGITAGNAPGVNDGAAALVLLSEDRARQLGMKPIATIMGHAEVALRAPYIAAAPGEAIRKLLNQTGLAVSNIELFEVNEAFAAVVLTSAGIVGWDEERVNVNGGAIALGHPLGASGARILMSLIYELRRRGGGLGIAAICSGTAQGDSVLIEIRP
ncbi:acetyl-CoA C-acetyltransferase [Paenibacillus sp. HB172176]|uniref:acetyl-CoA C-acetyltransferase n=1 Tax=Paenibacillus sp. HB172176 TaxID=2493690 RepID=UPI00143974FB|nr:acetyl-CoA C-acetyltransferase [Paenibacillus sp. HB172176]